MSYLQDLRAERDKFISTKNSLYTAISKVNNLKSQILMAADAFEEGVRGAGKDLDGTKFTEYSDNMETVSSNLSVIVQYCYEQITDLNNKIMAEEARLASLTGTSSTGGDTTSTSVKPDLHHKLNPRVNLEYQ